MTSNKTLIDRLHRLCVRWGGDFLVVKDMKAWDALPNNFSDAPFTSECLGVLWEEKKIVMLEGDEPPWPAVVHEMGHIFAAKQHPNYLKTEFDFFGWEYLVAKKIRGPMTEWHSEMGDYAVTGLRLDPELPGIGRFAEWGVLKDKEKKFVLDNRLEFARKNGLARGFDPLVVR